MAFWSFLGLVCRERERSLCGLSRHRMWVTNVPEIHHKDKRTRQTASFTRKQNHIYAHVCMFVFVCVLNKEKNRLQSRWSKRGQVQPENGHLSQGVTGVDRGRGGVVQSVRYSAHDCDIRPNFDVKKFTNLRNKNLPEWCRLVSLNRTISSPQPEQLS